MGYAYRVVGHKTNTGVSLVGGMFLSPLFPQSSMVEQSASTQPGQKYAGSPKPSRYCTYKHQCSGGWYLPNSTTSSETCKDRSVININIETIFTVPASVD